MKKNFRDQWTGLSEKVTKAPVEFWLILGLFVSFVIFYFVPTFFRSADSMAQGFDYITPRDGMIGGDHYEIVNSMSRSFLFDVPRFVLKGPYPPFTILFHMPFLLVDTKTSYILISLLSLASLIFQTLVLPARLVKTKGYYPFLTALFITGIFSYGFQFEVERGQYNLIALCLTLTSIWIFHRWPGMRWLAYLLFTSAVQLKVYPAIFIINLVDNWRDWKGIVQRFMGLGLLNFAMLFLFGSENFFRFFGGISKMATSDVSITVNHSIGSFVALVVGKLPALTDYSTYFVLAIVMLVFLCLALICYQTFINKFNGVNPFFILACVVIAQLIPRISFDYTLSIMPAAMAFFFVGIHENIKQSVVTSLSLFVICAAYGSTLFASPYKFAAKEMFPILTPFSNNFSALVIILIAVTILSLYIRPNQSPQYLKD